MAYRRRTLPSHNKGEKKGKSSMEKRKTSFEVQEIKKSIQNFARTSWGQHWVDKILQIGRPFRMRRALLYAKENRISNLNVTPGQIFATVQGTAPTPYRVKVQFETIPEEGWIQLFEFISSKAKYIIALLENRMSNEIADVFQEIGYSLYPDPNRIEASCSCPDNTKNNTRICKHIAATILYLALVIDFDPFILFKLRGKEKETILQELKRNRSCGNQPITQTYNRIRAQVDLSSYAFDVPILVSENVDTEQFLHSKGSLIPLYFSKPTGVIETLDNLGSAPNISDPEKFSQILSKLYLTVMKKAYMEKQKIDQN